MCFLIASFHSLLLFIDVFKVNNLFVYLYLEICSKIVVYLYLSFISECVLQFLYKLYKGFKRFSFHFFPSTVSWDIYNKLDRAHTKLTITKLIISCQRQNLSTQNLSNYKTYKDTNFSKKFELKFNVKILGIF